MARKKKIVNIAKDDVKSNESYGKNSSGKIIKLEDKGDPKKRATSKRFLAIVLWIMAIVFEIIGILRLNGTIEWLSSLSITVFLIIFIILDLICVVTGSLFWKKANHIDPASEKDKVKFWLWNNLGVVLSVIAFLPIIIIVLSNKDLDKRSKTIVSVAAVIALLIAGVSSYDFNPVSSEQLAKAEKEVLNVNEKGVVYWAPHSKKYHVDPDCPAFSQSETVYKGTVKQAFERGLTDPCRRCIPALHEHKEE